MQFDAIFIHYPVYKMFSKWQSHSMNEVNRVFMCLNKLYFIIWSFYFPIAHVEVYCVSWCPLTGGIRENYGRLNGPPFFGVFCCCFLPTQSNTQPEHATCI